MTPQILITEPCLGGSHTSLGWQKGRASGASPGPSGLNTNTAVLDLQYKLRCHPALL